MAAEKNYINSVIKALAVLECFSRELKELKLSEIARMLEMPKSTTSNLIYTLEKKGYIEQDIKTGKFRLGAKNFILGNIFEYHLNLVELARPFMESLRDKFNETVHLSIPSGDNGICVEKTEGYNTMGMNSQVGKNFPLHCTASGKLFLSAMSPERLEKFLQSMDLFKRTEDTITQPKLLREAVNRVKKQGYGLAVNESEIGLTSIAAPIYNYHGELVASLSIAAPTIRISEELREKMIQELLSTAREISLKLGYIE
jgi:IclR family KDG regulon transcriptional repressor